MAGTPLRPAELGYLGPGSATLTLTDTGDETARAILLGGPPFAERIVMWWNFIGRSHEDITRAREEWMSSANPDRFGEVQGYPGDRLPAPELPGIPLKPRGNAR